MTMYVPYVNLDYDIKQMFWRNYFRMFHMTKKDAVYWGMTKKKIKIETTCHEYFGKTIMITHFFDHWW